MTDNEIFQRAERFLSLLHHCQLLGMTISKADRQGLTICLPYTERIIGNPVTGGIHGGAITTLMDTTCGVSTVCALPEFEICPTLDLRIDYMHPTDQKKDIFGFAECYRVTPNIIFTRGVAYQNSPQEPIAHVVGTYMRLGKKQAWTNMGQLETGHES